MAEVDGLQHLGFADAVGAGFHHHDAGIGPGHGDAQLGCPHLVVGGVGDEFPVHQADPHGGESLGERNVGERQGRARSHHGQGIRIHLGVGGEHHGDHLGLVAKALGKQRADGPVDLPAGEDFFFEGRPSRLM